MGNDWGGRRKENPERCPRVTRDDVIAFATEHGYKVQRAMVYPGRAGFFKSTQGPWWFHDGRQWLTAGSTNYLALETLRALPKRRRRRSV
jgi:hypothetical protein